VNRARVDGRADGTANGIGGAPMVCKEGVARFYSCGKRGATRAKKLDGPAKIMRNRLANQINRKCKRCREHEHG
jgi:hypothetical protein